MFTNYQTMIDKIDYIDRLIASQNPDLTVIRALIFSLSPKQAIVFFDFSFDKSYKIRKYIAEKIRHDCSEKFQSFHDDLVFELIEMINQKSFRKRDTCAHLLNLISIGLPKDKHDEVLTFFLTSPYVRIRNRAYKQLLNNWDEKYEKRIENNWRRYNDYRCAEIVLKHFSTEYLINSYRGYLTGFESYQISKLFLRMYEKDKSVLNELSKIDEICYSYVLTKLNKRLSSRHAKQILRDNNNDERIGLLIWCFGQMGLWDLIIEYDRTYKKRN